MAARKRQESTKVGANSLERFAAVLDEVVTDLSGSVIGQSKARKVRQQLEGIARTLLSTSANLDLIRRPTSVFDPSNPVHFGRFIALTMIAQHRTPLAKVDKFYGSGIYAIYYTGTFSAYGPISKRESPIYVGKADPAHDKAVTAVEQGTKLWARIDEHRKSISKSQNLNVADFDCRFLVVASGWQKAAEEYLINLFRPVWNKEVRLVFGIGKHGDAADTRGNKRSPWDTLHSGRKWAGDERIINQKSEEQIQKQLSDHFKKVKPYKNQADIFARFMLDMRQMPTVSSSNDKTSK